MRHRNVADRIVDEMERELTAWLRREEDRPFAQYRFFYVPEESPPQVVNLARSPLSELPRDPSWSATSRSIPTAQSRAPCGRATSSSPPPPAGGRRRRSARWPSW